MGTTPPPPLRTEDVLPDDVVVVDGGAAATAGDDADCCEGCTVFDVVDVVVVVGGVEMNGESAIFPISNKDVPPTSLFALLLDIVPIADDDADDDDCVALKFVVVETTPSI